MVRCGTHHTEPFLWMVFSIRPFCMNGAAGTIRGGSSKSTGLTLFTTRGYRKPPKGLESIVSVTFQPSGAATEVILCQTGIPNDELGRRHKEGRGSVLSKLADRLVSSESSASRA